MMRNWGARRSSTLWTEMCCGSGAETERLRQRRGALEDENRSVLDALGPVCLCRRAAPAGITSTSPCVAAFCKPIEERIAGHPPAIVAGDVEGERRAASTEKRKAPLPEHTAASYRVNAYHTPMRTSLKLGRYGLD